MSYNKAFYDAYDEYLKELTVREAHDWVFEVFVRKGLKAFNNIIDLGCGRSKEISKHVYNSYTGLDSVAPNSVKIDYRKDDIVDVFKKLEKLYYNYAFSSLFSIEATGSTKDNYALYDKLFKETKVNAGLVSGFYYESKKDKETVEESGGIISYQSIDSMTTHELYHERRIIMHVPSKMFGDDVYEVWKLFVRN